MSENEKLPVPTYKASQGSQVILSSVPDSDLNLDVDSCLQNNYSFQLWQEEVSLKSEIAEDPPKEIGWLGTAGLLCAGIIGSGVLTIGINVANVGWVPGIIMLLCTWPINTYTGILLQRAILKCPDRRKVPTLLHLYKELSPLWLAYIMQTINWIINFFLVVNYVTVAAQALGSIFYDVHICLPVWGIIVLPIILFFMTICRSQKIASYLTWPSMIAILISIILSIASMFSDYSTRPALEYGNLPAVKPGISIDDIVNSMTKFIFAYSGQQVYVEIIAEMKQPKNFVKSIFLSGSVQVSMYLLVAITSNLYMGEYTNGSEMITEYISYNICKRLANAALFLHIVTVVPIIGQVITRPVHFLVDKKSGNANDMRGHMVWFLCNVLMVTLAGSFAVLFPYIGIIQNFTGALMAVPCFISPGIAYIFACKVSKTKVHPVDKTLIVLISFIAGISLFCYGIYTSITRLAVTTKNGGGFLSCNCATIWEYGCVA